MCNNACRVCRRMVFSQAVTFAGDTLTINIPAGSYNDGERYCIVVVQDIPDATTINAGVVITIGEGTAEYQLTTRKCRQATAGGLRTRTVYPVRVATSADGGVFRMLTDPCCTPDNRPPAIDGTVPAAEGGAGA